ncbi:MAG: hypothetical protein E6G47_06060 [Actinobacteria bacterium]|nr:MAG: hypothetical protein E6G47_06060 [Actinomycetota bacterium]
MNEDRAVIELLCADCGDATDCCEFCDSDRCSVALCGKCVRRVVRDGHPQGGGAQGGVMV